MHRINSKYRKLKLFNDDMPTLSDVRTCLGLPLTEIFFEYSHDESKNILGLTRPLKLPEKCFSIESPMNEGIIKEHVHQNILELGEEILEKFKFGIEEEVGKRVRTQLEENFHVYQARKRREMELYTQELHTKYENYIKAVQQKLEETLKFEWANAIAKCNKSIQKAVVQKRMDVTHDMLQKMRTEICYVVKSLYQDFEESFCAQKENMIADFNEIIRAERIKMIDTVKDLERKRVKDLQIQRHELEMQNAVDVIYVLCISTLRSRTEKHAIHTYFEQQISIFHNLIRHLNDCLDMMKNEVIECHQKIRLLEKQAYEIAEEFQKFVNFALTAVSGQALYLLP